MTIYLFDISTEEVKLFCWIIANLNFDFEGYPEIDEKGSQINWSLFYVV
jgi:hypothetical protein